MDLSADAIKEIIRIQKMEKVKVGEVDFFTKSLFPAPQYEASAIQASTLAGVVDYINLCAEKDMAKDLIIHVRGPREVVVCSNLQGVQRERESFINATPVNDTFKFGDTYQHEEFVIAMMSQFVETDDSKLVMQFISQVKIDAGMKTADNGVSQTVVATVALGTDAQVEVPNPISLRPIRTFPEIDQPESKFVFRLMGKLDDGIKCAIFEADGGQWRVDAIKEISQFLSASLNEKGCTGIPIIA